MSSHTPNSSNGVHRGSDNFTGDDHLWVNFDPAETLAKLRAEEENREKEESKTEESDKEVEKVEPAAAVPVSNENGPPFPNRTWEERIAAADAAYEAAVAAFAAAGDTNETPKEGEK
ncbi:hypothetical protein VFPPC_13957 [Pochonia chlamydosporia 170]|uniref:Uncharacterized protein n=1 Tax=Pochonia chlamydosporia 170 TaxID=1380566 RepID=A0A179FGY7_METCM|nr:hypothetical protein VFPPC_13957 [Pochonia chlamydosporia 170]OAQ64865.1 hypothetical protein VFPPC_13957 [Pochonia chlamydosporia 170]